MFDISIIDMLLGAVAGFSAGFLIIKYIDEWKENNIDQSEKILASMLLEMKVMESWTGPYHSDLNIDDTIQLSRHPDFWNPSRVIFEFNYDSFRNLLDNNAIKNLDPDTITSSNNLRQAIDNFYQYYGEYRKFVLSQPNLFIDAVNFFNDPNPDLANITDIRLKSYLYQIYSYNYTLHYQLIGDENNMGIHQPFITLRDKILSYSFNQPKIIRLARVVGWSFIFVGIFLFLTFLSFNIDAAITKLF